MTIPCPHWSDCGLRHGGCCALGLFGGRPSYGVCASACIEPPSAWRMTWQPMVDPVPPAAPARPLLPMPGDVLHTLIKQLGFHQTAGCGCASMQRQMNEWGWVGCWQHREEIVAWLTEKAKEQGIEVESKDIFGLLKAALQQIKPV